MSIKSKVFAANGSADHDRRGLAPIGATSASAATPSSGNSCINVFSPVFGTHKNPSFVLDVLRQGEKVASRSSCSAPPTSTRRKTT